MWLRGRWWGLMVLDIASNTLPCPHIPYGMKIFHGIHMDSIWDENIPWIPHGMRDLVEFENKKNCLHLFYIYSSLQKW